MSVADLLEGKNPSVRADVKAEEYAKIDSLLRDVLAVEKITVEVLYLVKGKVPGSTEVLFRAWDIDGDPIGFGKDGSAEIKWVRFHNPPIMVPDGTTKSVIHPYTGKTVFVPNFKEDLKAALFYDVSHTVKLIGKLKAKVEKGKISYSTNVYRPLAGTGTAPVDGIVMRQAVDQEWAAIIVGAGNYVDNTSATFQFFGGCRASSTGPSPPQFHSVYRGGFGFPTSDLSGYTVDVATLSLRAQERQTGLGSGWALDIVSFSPASETALANGDFGSFGSTVFAEVGYSSISTSAFTDFLLDANGIANINKSGNSWFGTRLDWDVDGSFGGSWSSLAFAGPDGYMADQADVTYDPKLTIEYSGGGGGVALQNRRAFRGIVRGILRGV